MTIPLMDQISTYVESLDDLNTKKLPIFKSQLKRTTTLLHRSMLPTDMSVYQKYVDKSDYHLQPVIEQPVPKAIEVELANVAKPILEKYDLKFGHVFICMVTSNTVDVPQHLHLSSIIDTIEGRSRAFSMFISTDGSPCAFSYFNKNVQADAISHNLTVRANQEVLKKYTDSCPEEFKEIICNSGDVVCFDSRAVLHGATFQPKNESSVGLWFVFDMCSFNVEQTDLVVKIHEPLLD